LRRGDSEGGSGDGVGGPRGWIRAPPGGSMDGVESKAAGAPGAPAALGSNPQEEEFAVVGGVP